MTDNGQFDKEITDIEQLDGQKKKMLNWNFQMNMIVTRRHCCPVSTLKSSIVLELPDQFFRLPMIRCHGDESG